MKSILLTSYLANLIILGIYLSFLFILRLYIRFTSDHEAIWLGVPFIGVVMLPWFIAWLASTIALISLPKQEFTVWKKIRIVLVCQSFLIFVGRHLIGLIPWNKFMVLGLIILAGVGFTFFVVKNRREIIEQENPGDSLKPAPEE